MKGMKRLILPFLAVAMLLPLQAQTNPFVRGADVSWCTEMEADGMRFYDADKNETDIFELMKNIGMTAIRLRVWVAPDNYGYGAWSDKADVLVKARRAHAQGLDLLIDFHYSDYFADPGRQTKPAAWADMSFSELETAVADHTTDVLKALKDEGIEPKWVQVGNETTSGMIWDDGRIDWNEPESTRRLNYIALSNAGYNAVKSVLPEATVIVHHDNAPQDNTWFYQAFKDNGGKFDMIGLSHYPDWDNWSNDNADAVSSLRKLYATFHLPVMLVETGFSNWDEVRAKNVMQDLFDKMLQEEGCAGIFYWEPEVYGGWGHLVADDGTVWHNKGNYGTKVASNGAFTMYGQPSDALLVFGRNATDAIDVIRQDDTTQCRKIVYHGQLLIIRDGKMFNMLGIIKK